MTLFYACEDDLTSAVIKRLIHHFNVEVKLKPLNAGQGGNAILKKNIEKYIKLAAQQKVLLVTDLDTFDCAPSLIHDWLDGRNITENFTFRVAVREVESWLLADRTAISDWMGVDVGLIPATPDSLDGPKDSIIHLARRSRNSELKSGIPPQRGANAKVGLGYNNLLVNFVRTFWSADRARANSDSLQRAYHEIARIRP